jgi:hypothetical protein
VIAETLGGAHKPGRKRTLAGVSAHPLVVAARAIGVRDARVLDAVAAVPRASYVPQAHVDEADLDRPIPIGSGQVTTQPSLVAAMVEALALHGGERVLEVGTGNGCCRASARAGARPAIPVLIGNPCTAGKVRAEHEWIQGATTGHDLFPSLSPLGGPVGSVLAPKPKLARSAPNGLGSPCSWWTRRLAPLSGADLGRGDGASPGKEDRDD